MTNCTAMILEPGACFYCTMTKGENGEDHEAQCAGGQVISKWAGQFIGRKKEV